MARFLRAFLDRAARCAGAIAPRGRRAPIRRPQKQKRKQAMKQPPAPPAFGTLIEPTTLKIQRLLPGPVERIWAYLTDGELRRKWLAAGAMEMKTGTPFELVWRNEELSDPPVKRPEGFGEEHRMASRITELDPPHKISFTWN